MNEPTRKLHILSESWFSATPMWKDCRSRCRILFPLCWKKGSTRTSTTIRFEVLNLGQSGFGTAEEYMRYIHFGVQYSPDLVILALLTGNDFLDNSRVLSSGGHEFYFVIDKNRNLVLGRYVIDDYQRNLTLPKRLFQNLKRKSYLASLISERLYPLREEIRTNCYRKHFAESRPEGMERKLDEFSVLNKTYGLPFDYGKPDRMPEDFARQNGLSFLKLMPMFLDPHLKTGQYLHGFGSGTGGHWNENGHCLAAEKIFEFLQENGLVSLDAMTGRTHPHACASPYPRTARGRAAAEGRP
jgi:hypothetical protein